MFKATKFESNIWHPICNSSVFYKFQFILEELEKQLKWLINTLPFGVGKCPYLPKEIANATIKLMLP